MIQNSSDASARNPSSSTTDEAAFRPPATRAKRSESARLLIIRFSSFGDIVQALGVPAAFREHFAQSEVDWLVREDFRGLIDNHPAIRKVIAFSRRAGVKGLIKTAWQLAGEDYSHVYDAHNNLRSHLVSWVFTARGFCDLLGGRRGPHRGRAPLFLRRPKDRLRRWLFFRFRLKTLPQPFKGAESFIRPLAPWGLSLRVPQAPQFFTSAHLPPEISNVLAGLPRPLIALAPSAAWEMKRWPLVNFKALVRLMPESGFALLGGPEDHFIQELQAVAPERTVNLAGRLSLAQSAALMKEADLVIANDTGLLHVADQMGKNTLALIGPTAFGYTSQPNSRVLEIDLACKPCSKDGRGRCTNSLYQRCLVELSPERVAQAAGQALKQGLTPPVPATPSKGPQTP